MSLTELILFFSASFVVFFAIFWQIYQANKRLKKMNPNYLYTQDQVGLRSCRKCTQIQELFKSSKKPSLRIWMQSGEIENPQCLCHADCAYYEEFKQIWRIQAYE